MRTLLVCSLLCSAACGGTDPGFDPKPRAAGAAMWLEVDVTAKGALVEVWATELGPVFGLAAHVEVDAEHLDIADLPPTAAAPLGSAETTNLWTRRSGRLVFGSTRERVAAGEIEINEPTLLTSLELMTRTEGSSALRISRAVVRRSDGSYVAIATSGGTLTTGGAP